FLHESVPSSGLARSSAITTILRAAHPSIGMRDASVDLGRRTLVMRPCYSANAQAATRLLAGRQPDLEELQACLADISVVITCGGSLATTTPPGFTAPAAAIDVSRRSRAIVFSADSNRRSARAYAAPRSGSAGFGLPPAGAVTRTSVVAIA